MSRYRLAIVALGALVVPVAASAAGLDLGSSGSVLSSFLGGFVGSWASRWSLLRAHERECAGRRIRDAARG